MPEWFWGKRLGHLPRYCRTCDVRFASIMFVSTPLINPWNGYCSDSNQKRFVGTTIVSDEPDLAPDRAECLLQESDRVRCDVADRPLTPRSGGLGSRYGVDPRTSATKGADGIQFALLGGTAGRLRRGQNCGPCRNRPFWPCRY